MDQILFYIFATILVVAALRVITARSAVHAALFLVLSFFTSAALWLLIEVEFLAIALVLVYVGAVMVLFLFVVMMLDLNLAPQREGFVKALPGVLLVAAIVLAEMIAVLTLREGGSLALVRNAAEYSNTEALGVSLFTDHLFAFEVAGAILFVAIVAAIALVHRKSKGGRRQFIARQVAVRREDRVRLLDIREEDA